MARKPNFDFERQERDKAKAAKKAAKAEAKNAKKDDSSDGQTSAEREAGGSDVRN